MKKSKCFLTYLLFVSLISSIFCNCTTTSIINIEDIPLSTPVQTLFEGTWEGYNRNYKKVYFQFSGNNYNLITYIYDAYTVFWEKGIFSFDEDEKKIITYPLYSYSGGILRNTSYVHGIPNKWEPIYRVSSMDIYNGVKYSQTCSYSYKYEFISNNSFFMHGKIPFSLTNKIKFRKTNEKIPMPEDYVFLCNNVSDRPFAGSETDTLFLIEKIDDGINIGPNLRSDYRLPGTYKISFKQTSGNMTYTGHFTKYFEPGVYEFSLATNGNILRVISKRHHIIEYNEQVKGAETEYIDIQLNR